MEDVKLKQSGIYDDALKNMDFSYIDTVMQEFHKKIVNEKDEIIKQRLVGNGIDVNDAEYLKEHLSRVIKEDERYEHYFFDFGKETEKRIISIDRQNSFPLPDFSNSENGHKLTWQTKYY